MQQVAATVIGSFLGCQTAKNGRRVGLIYYPCHTMSLANILWACFSCHRYIVCVPLEKRTTYFKGLLLKASQGHCDCWRISA